MTPDHQRVIDAFASAANADETVVAAYVGGSIGAGTSDHLSDVDCKLVFRDDISLARAWSNRGEWFARLGDVVVVADGTHIGPGLQLGVVNGLPPLLVDLAYAAVGALQPSPWYRELLILKDPERVAANLVAKSQILEHAAPTDEELSNLTAQFWRWAMFTARDIRRGDVSDALVALAFIRGHALRPMAATIAGQGWHRFVKLERHLSGDAQTWLRAGTPRSLVSADLADALRAQMDAFHALRAQAQARRPFTTRANDDACRSAVESILGHQRDDG